MYLLVWLLVLGLTALILWPILDNVRVGPLRRPIGRAICYEELVTVANALEKSAWLRRRLRRMLLRNHDRNRRIILDHVWTDAPGRATRQEVEKLYRYVLLIEDPQRDSLAELELWAAFFGAQLLRQRLEQHQTKPA